MQTINKLEIASADPRIKLVFSQPDCLSFYLWEKVHTYGILKLRNQYFCKWTFQNKNPEKCGYKYIILQLWCRSMLYLIMTKFVTSCFLAIYLPVLMISLWSEILWRMHLTQSSGRSDIVTLPSSFLWSWKTFLWKTDNTKCYIFWYRCL